MPLFYLFAQNVTANEATINFGHDEKTCGHFVAQLQNVSTGVWTTYNFAVSPLNLTSLEPCTEYTISISHVTSLQACIGDKITFTTACPGYCDAEGLNVEAGHLDLIGFDVPGVIDFWDNIIQDELYPSEGYMNITSPILRLEPNEEYGFSACFSVSEDFIPAEVDIKVWIDFDKDFEFEANELVAGYYNSSISGLCLSLIDGFVIPTEEVCRAPARIILSINNGEITSPCGNVPLGQVVDFFVNVGECVIKP